MIKNKAAFCMQIFLNEEFCTILDLYRELAKTLCDLQTY